VLEALIAILLSPISAHAFYTKAISKMYLAKTADESLFYEKKNNKFKLRMLEERKLKKSMNKRSRNLSSKNRNIKIDTAQSV
jgi:hypothetical protein